MNSVQTEEARIHQAYEQRATADARYSWFEDGYLFEMQHVERRMLAALRHHGLAPLHSRRILEIGCGNGHWLRQFIQWGARPENLAGVDLLEGRVDEAKKLCASNARIYCANASTLQFADGTFDVVFQATVFTSILDPDLKTQVAAEMMRVTRDDGLIFWYDFRFDNPRNPDVRGVNRREIQKLFPGCSITLQRVTLAPPIARRIAPYSWLACYLLSKIPWLCSHYIGVIRKARYLSCIKVH
jgi:ubiquinone/menaquinone biosynthesis C-methylase UbiE